MPYGIQIERIRKKLSLAKKKDAKYEIFGAKSHQYKFKKPLTIIQVEAFEKEYQIELPKGYVAFITEIGNQGKKHQNSSVDHSVAGPSYGIYPLEKSNANFLEDPKAFFKQEAILSPNISDKEWNTIFDVEDDAYDSAINKYFSGIMPIGSMGCTFEYGLVLNGKYKGYVVNIDVDLQKPSFETTFLDWYENWLDEILQSKKYQTKLLSEVASDDNERILLALKSLHKFKKIKNTDALISIANHSNSEIRDSAIFLLTKHNYEIAKPYLIALINNQDDSTALIACQAIHWYVKKKHINQWSEILITRLKTVNSERLLDFAFYVLNKTKQDLAPLLQNLATNKNSGIRNTAYYNIGLLKSNTAFDKVLKNALEFEDKDTSITVLQAIGKLNGKSYIPFYKAILIRIPNDTYIISNIINLLEEIGIETIDDEIQQHIKTHFDSIENDDDYELSNYLIDFKRIPLPRLLEHATQHSEKGIKKKARKVLKKMKKK